MSYKPIFVTAASLVLACAVVADAQWTGFRPSGASHRNVHPMWQRQADGSWKVIFDKGCPPCDCPAKP